MKRLYEWTPDECIPEFYEDAQIFESIHDDMESLQTPSWTVDGQAFIDWHRGMLESDHVSAQLHNWIDLTFGYKVCQLFYPGNDQDLYIGIVFFSYAAMLQFDLRMCI